MARKIPPRGGDRGGNGGPRDHHPAAQGEHRTDDGTAAGGAGDRGAGRWRQPPLRPTRAPDGEVRWWERPAPEQSEPRLWEAVQRIQARRLQLQMTVTDLAVRLGQVGHSLRRETLSRILNGKQPTTWETAQRLAEIVGVNLPRRCEDTDG